MVKYLIYTAIAILIAWSVFYLIKVIGRQLKGQGSCDGACGSCSRNCQNRKPKE